MTEIGPLLRSARGDRTIYRVERDCGVSHSVISKAERGLALPTLANLAILITYYQQDDQEERWVSALVNDRVRAARLVLVRLREEALAIEAQAIPAVA